MDERFTVYIDRLKGGKNEEIDLILPPHFMEIEEEDLMFEESIQVKGKAYLAEDHLIMHLDIETQAMMPCARCNQPSAVPLFIEGFYHTVPLEDIKEGIYHFGPMVREAILLELPSFHSCSDEECLGSELVKKYFKQEKQSGGSPNTYHPFENLE